MIATCVQVALSLLILTMKVNIAILLLIISGVCWGSELSATQQLGRYLFFDTSLSLHSNRSCALCHSPTHGWSNTFNKTIDIYGKPSTLNTPSLLNVIHRRQFSQTNPRATELEQAILNPLFSVDPLEMGMTVELLVARLSRKPLYLAMFETGFGDSEVTIERVATALEDYLSLVQSQDTRVHRYQQGQHKALSAQELLGWQLFSGDRLNCSKCHGGVLFDTPSDEQEPFRNTGLYGALDAEGFPSYPMGQLGLEGHSGKKKDNGKFRIPSLINVAHTSPWGHDGSIQSLESLLDLYARGGRKLTYGTNQGDGRAHPAKSEWVSGFQITRREREALLAFLNALSIDRDWTRYPFNSPFCEQADSSLCDR
ncbi:methylamine utilization protein mauG [Vibrio ishigakensis]|uniref:Methylamine utilization protein mauG n=2 Tax=Vibrio ishigakensis TaxID=1481914 RepID=A0A0B8NV10_9VIBR|nr:methylamine utilization protein mauG [Vibrio ishigakensis]